jgi:hypothetical protein
VGFTFVLGSFCLVAITGFGLGVIYDHDENNDYDIPILLYVHG